MDFNDFMQLWGQLELTLEAIFITIMEDIGRKAKNEPQKWHIYTEWHV